jgi:hypothetical protein
MHSATTAIFLAASVWSAVAQLCSSEDTATIAVCDASYKSCTDEAVMTRSPICHCHAAYLKCTVDIACIKSRPHYKAIRYACDKYCTPPCDAGAEPGASTTSATATGGTSSASSAPSGGTSASGDAANAGKDQSDSSMATRASSLLGVAATALLSALAL